MYDQEKGYIGHKFRKSLIEYEYGITAKPITSGDLMSDTILEKIHQVLGNLVRNFNIQQTYVDKSDPWTGILAAAEIAILSETRRQKVYSPGKLIFGRDMVPPIKQRVDWELICQIKQTQINRDKARKNKHRVDYDYKV